MHLNYFRRKKPTYSLRDKRFFNSTQTNFSHEDNCLIAIADRQKYYGVGLLLKPICSTNRYNSIVLLLLLLQITTAKGEKYCFKRGLTVRTFLLITFLLVTLFYEQFRRVYTQPICADAEFHLQQDRQ